LLEASLLIGRRLTHDVTLDNISTVDEADTSALVYEHNKQNDAYHQQQQQRQTVSSTTLLDKLHSRVESRNQRNVAKSKLTSNSKSLRQLFNNTCFCFASFSTDLSG